LDDLREGEVAHIVACQELLIRLDVPATAREWLGTARQMFDARAALFERWRTHVA